MHLQNRSDRATSPLQCVRASGCAKTFPSTADARSHLQLPQSQPRRSSFQEALQEVACRMQALGKGLRSRWRAFQLGLLPPCKKREACPSELFLGTLPLESKPDSFPNMSHPPPSLSSLTLYQLGLVAMNFLSLGLRLRHCRRQCDSLLDKASARRWQTTLTTTTTTTTTTTNNNNNNNNNNNIDNNNTPTTTTTT